MFKRSIYLGLLLAAIASQTSSLPHRRVARSPDSTMEVQVPDNSQDYEYDPDNEYSKEAGEEADYWQNEEKTMEENNSGSDGDRLDEEREYQEDQNDQYRNEGNNTMTQGRENGEDHQNAAGEHYANGDNDYNQRADELNGNGEKVDRYQEKGEADMNNQQEKMENYDADAKAPSFNYSNQ